MLHCPTRGLQAWGPQLPKRVNWKLAFQQRSLAVASAKKKQRGDMLDVPDLHSKLARGLASTMAALTLWVGGLGPVADVSAYAVPAGPSATQADQAQGIID